MGKSKFLFGLLGHSNGDVDTVISQMDPKYRSLGQEQQPQQRLPQKLPLQQA